MYCKAPFDPESVASTENFYTGIDYFMMPSTRNIGFNVNINSDRQKWKPTFIMMRLLLAFAVVTVATSCLDNFDEYNHNPNETTDESWSATITTWERNSPCAERGDTDRRAPLSVYRDSRRRRLRRLCRIHVG